MNIERKGKGEREREENLEFSILLVKPNGVKLGLVGIIRQELIEQGFNVINEAEVKVSRKSGELMYGGLGIKKKPVIDHICSGESYLFMICGRGVIRKVRELVGHTAWKDRPDKGLRGKYAENHIENTVHAPDSHKEAVKELTEVFPKRTEEVLRSQIADELNSFLNNEEAIQNGKRFVNQYSV